MEPQISSIGKPLSDAILDSHTHALRGIDRSMSICAYYLLALRHRTNSTPDKLNPARECSGCLTPLTGENMSNGAFENQPKEICSHLSKKAPKSRFLKPEKFQNHSNEGKGKEKKRKCEEKEGRRSEKSNGCTLSFYNSYFGDSFWPK